MEILKRTNRFYCTRPEGYPQIRVYHKEGSGKIMPRYLLKCGCCDEKLEIYYDDEGLEMEPHGQSPWYLDVLRRNPPKHTLLRTRLRRVILFAFIHGHRPWSSA
jgi:hypothetical protein